MSGQSARCITYLMFLVIVVLIGVINLLCIQTDALLPVSPVVDFSANSNEPLLLVKDQLYFAAAYATDENYSLSKLGRIRKKYIHHCTRFLYSIFNIKTVQRGFTALLLISFLILANAMNKKIPIIALFMGGHDPPGI